MYPEDVKADPLNAFDTISRQQTHCLNNKGMSLLFKNLVQTSPWAHSFRSDVVDPILSAQLVHPHLRGLMISPTYLIHSLLVCLVLLFV